MQVKANRVLVSNLDGTPTEFTDVEVIQGGNGLFVDHEVVIGKDNEGNDLKQKRFTLYPWEKVYLLEWNEPTLIEQVKEFVILTELEDFSELLEELQEELGIEEDEEEEPTSKTAPKSKGQNPYEN